MNSFDRLSSRLKRRLVTRWLSVGAKVECCFCGWTGRAFLPAGLDRVPNRLCPKCGSLQRHRMLFLYLKQFQGFEDQPRRLLEVAPKKCFTDYCSRLANIDYVSMDLSNPKAMVQTDLTDACFKDAEFDMIICFHVLEHIPEDRKALREMYRMLRPGGSAIVSIPFRGTETFEDPNADPSDYLRLYGQKDHVRIYGNDFIHRMRDAGFETTMVDVQEKFGDVADRHALRGDDRYFFVGTVPE